MSDYLEGFTQAHWAIVGGAGRKEAINAVYVQRLLLSRGVYRDHFLGWTSDKWAGWADGLVAAFGL